jgi:hypothetical protein
LLEQDSTNEQATSDEARQREFEVRVQADSGLLE